MKTKKVLIGHVGVDSGQLMVTDPCYLGMFDTKAEYQDVRRYRDEGTGKVYQYRVDFENFESLIGDYLPACTPNQLIKRGVWVELADTFPPTPDYNGMCHNSFGTPGGKGIIPFPLGHDGLAVVFRSGYGDGVYPVYAHVKDDPLYGERVVRVTIDMG